MNYADHVRSGEVGTTQRRWRSRVPVVVLVLACVAAVVVALSGAAKPLHGLHFFSSGHWVYHEATDTVYHVDGASQAVDAEVDMNGMADPDSQVVQGDKSGYVVGKEHVVEFGKADMSVAGVRPSVSPEPPVMLEANGGPYAVYRQAGRIMRFGADGGPIDVGGPLADPVVTSDGTLWLLRVDNGLLCWLAKDARLVSCPVSVPEGHRGKLTVVADRPAFVDTTTDSVHPLGPAGLGEGVPMGVDVPTEVEVAPRDVDGRVAVLDPQAKRLVLVDAKPLTRSGRPEQPLIVPLAGGDYEGPASTGDAVALLDRSSNTVETYGGDGRQIARQQLPGEPADREQPLITGEDGRVYADGKRGDHVLVVDHDGKVADVDLTGANGDGERTAKDRTADRNVDRAPSRRPDRTDRERPRRQQEQPSASDRSVDDRPEGNVLPDPKPATPPGAPRDVSASPGNASAVVSWSPPRSTGGGAITGYRITWAGGSRTVSADATSARITGLTNGRSYVFTVAARNAAGLGTKANSRAVTPRAVPTVDVVSARQTGDREVTLTVRVDGGGDPNVTCRVTWQRNSAGRTMLCNAASNGGTATRQLVIGNLPPGSYTFYASGENRAGRGPRGRGATVQVIGPKLVLTKGEPTDEYCGDLPGCAWMHIEFTGFEPGSSVHLDPYSSDPDYDNPGATIVIDEDGTASTDRFAYAGTGHTVWVVATLPDGTKVKSNEMVW